MLNILRRYQKGIFLFTATIVIISFSFFGSYKVMGRADKDTVAIKKDLQVAKAIDGSAIYQSQIDKMIRFLSEEEVVYTTSQGLFYPNIFNDEFITKDIFDSKIALVLGKYYFEFFSEQLKHKQERFKHFKTYEHPSAPYISVKNIWEKFAPDLFRDYQEFQALPIEETFRLFEKMVELYLHSKTISGPLMKQLMVYLEGQYAFVEKDPYLQNVDFSIFHAHSLKDWFGENFMEILCQFVMNGAKYAKENGYVVTYEEAKASLFNNAREALQRQNKEIGDNEINAHFNHFLWSYNLTEKDAVDIWQQILLFRRLFQDNAAKVFLDPVLYEDYVSFASKEANITLYQLPKECQIENLRDLYLLETYLKSIGKQDKKDLLSVNIQPYSEEEIEINTPELIQKTFKIQLAHVTKEDLKLSIGVKELWDYEIQDQNWKRLVKNNPHLLDITTKADRLKALQSIDVMQRNEINDRAKEEIVDLHPDWAVVALGSIGMKEETIHVPYYGDSFVLKGFSSGKELIAFLSSLKEETVFTKDGKNFYKVAVLASGFSKILSFKEAKESKALDLLLDRHLKMAYEKYKDTNSDLKGLEFEACKDKVGLIVYKSLLDQLKMYAHSLGITTQISDMDEIAKTRFLKFLDKKKEEFMQQQTCEVLTGCMNQFELQKQDVVLKRNAYAPLADDQFFRMKKGEWSDVVTLRDGNIGFFKMNSIDVNQQELMQEIDRGRKLLGDESKRFIAGQLIKEMQHKSTISLEKEKDIIADAP